MYYIYMYIIYIYMYTRGRPSSIEPPSRTNHSPSGHRPIVTASTHTAISNAQGGAAPHFFEWTK